jgi:DNA-binding response OmpR family regulator
MTVPQMRRNECTVDGEVVRLRPTMARVVACLLMRRGQIVPYDDLVECAYPDADTQPLTARQTLKVMTSQHRSLIGEYVRTVWGRGMIVDLPEPLA